METCRIEEEIITIKEMMAIYELMKQKEGRCSETNCELLFPDSVNTQNEDSSKEIDDDDDDENLLASNMRMKMVQVRF